MPIIFLLSLCISVCASGQVEIKRVHVGKTRRAGTEFASDSLGQWNIAVGDFNGDSEPDYCVEASRDVSLLNAGGLDWAHSNLRFFSGISGEALVRYRAPSIHAIGWNFVRRS